MAVSGHVQTPVVEGFASGFVNSLHCAGMCGPLSAFYLERPLAAVAYHGARSTSYALVGASAGALGLALGAGDWAAGGAWFAIALALSMFLMALGFERWHVHLARAGGQGAAAGQGQQGQRSGGQAAPGDVGQ